MDFNFVTPRLATGGEISTEADVQALVNAGITHIISCRAEFDDASLLAAHPSIGYLHNGVVDDGQPKPVDWFGRSIEFALRALAQPHTKVYAHCQAGVNRGPSTAFAIMLALGWTPLLARLSIVTARPITVVGIHYAADAEAAVKALGYV